MDHEENVAAAQPEDGMEGSRSHASKTNRPSVWQRLGLTIRRRTTSRGELLPSDSSGTLSPLHLRTPDPASSFKHTSDVYSALTDRLPVPLVSDYNHANFLWGDGAGSSDNPEEDESDTGEEARRRDFSILRRSDPQAILRDHSSESDTSVSVNRYLVPTTTEESVAMGYILDSQDSREIQQQDSSSWDSVNEDELPVLSGWNEDFQRFNNRIRAFTPHTSAAEQMEAYADLIGLTEDFLIAVQSYGRIIISEAHLPPGDKTVQPTSMGGVIGGEKYSVQGILFKFSTDSCGIFDGHDSDSISAKIAGHELKCGLLAAANCAGPDLVMPLIALVDYKGFRLIAMSLLPISKNTLVLGSADGGITVESRSDPLTEQVAQLGRALNLKGHLAGATKDGSKFLYTPLDLEGHIGTDGKNYLCDFSRMMPPETPRRDVKQAYLYQLLRREFVTALEYPLSSDAFSQFTKVHESHVEDNAEVEHATLLLYEVVVPRVAADLEALLRSHSDKLITNFRLSAALHSHGVNVRHLFRVFQHAKDTMFRALIIVEMVARVVVADIRDKLRRTTRTLPMVMVEAHYLKVLCARCNLVFGNTLASVSYWNKLVRKRVWAKFCLHLGPTPTPEILAQYPFFQRTVSFKVATMAHVIWSMPSMHVLFVRLQQILGFSLKKSVEQQLTVSSVFVKLCARAKPFRPSDWSSLGMRVKHMNMVSFAKGFLYLTQGLAVRASDPKRAVQLLSSSVKQFEDSLAANTSSKVTLRACAKALMHFDEESRRAEVRGKRKQSSVSTDDGTDHSAASSMRSSAMLSRADLYCRRAIQADVTDAQSYYAYGAFLDRIGNKKAAEAMYIEALKLNAFHVETLKSYGDLLSEQERHGEAEALFLLAREQSRKEEQLLNIASPTAAKMVAAAAVGASMSPSMVRE